MDKIYYINELGYPNGYHKSFTTHRLPQAYIEYTPMYSVSYDTIYDEIKENNNIIIFQTPTNNELFKLKIIQQLIENNTVFITQESNIFDWFDWTAEEQNIYIDILSKCKAFLYHNEYDMNVMKIFTSNFIKYPGCINWSVDNPKTFDDGKYIFIPTPVKRYQRGMISYKIISDVIKDIPIYSMKYTSPKNYPLSFPDNYQYGDIKLIDRMTEHEWVNFIYNAKFGLDIHKEFSGGNVSLEFGALGTPLVGNINLDTQRDIFPDLSFEFNDYENIKSTIKLLINDIDFYNEVSLKALNNVKEKYNSEIIVNKFKQDISKFI